MDPVDPKAKKYIIEAGLELNDIQEMNYFPIKLMYQKLRGVQPKVPWKKLVCNNYATPRWVFILNLAIQGRLTTKERLLRWGMQVKKECVLCGWADETTSHLFFERIFSKEIRQRLLNWQGINKHVKIWEDEIHWETTEMKGKNSIDEIFRMTIAGAVYYIWQERNLRLFQNKQRNVISILKEVVQDLFVRGGKKYKLASRLRLKFLSIVSRRDRG